MVMVDRASRKRLGEELRHYVACLVTNYELDALEVDWRDSGAVAVKEYAWSLYDDLHKHYAKGPHKLSKEARDMVARWILFLHSDIDYTWPRYSFMQIVNWPMNLLTFGHWEARKARRFQEFQTAGDFDVWPFARREDFEAALARPKLLSGGK